MLYTGTPSFSASCSRQADENTAVYAVDLFFFHFVLVCLIIILTSVFYCYSRDKLFFSSILNSGKTASICSIDILLYLVGEATGMLFIIVKIQFLCQKDLGGLSSVFVLQ